MAISPTSSTSLYRNVEQTNKPVSKDQLKNDQNSAILQAQLEVSVQSGNQPMALLYRTAIDAINEQLAPEFGDNAAQQALDEGIDVSPEATAERIVAGSTKYFDAFLEVNTDLQGEEALNEYMSIIQGAVDKGFEEARDILDSLAVLEGDIADNINLTYDFVQSGLQNFADSYLSRLSEQNPPADPA
ncbi:DUF5610 domain-containing protein [Neiella sp. HB171785]|uniref:DUF5610 domain-containing protein n=1 Tax=Neiella litorisoli TaxID=2771431 RepID=A0A8J6UQJ1_9GAMM|nr:DUF5610 domain-containing protein [Neiella litorisoli]MBD1391382.1 DUF5610 domain-containing protein [Neiella litorisoli]